MHVTKHKPDCQELDDELRRGGSRCVSGPLVIGDDVPDRASTPPGGHRAEHRRGEAADGAGREPVVRPEPDRGPVAYDELHRCVGNISWTIRSSRTGNDAQGESGSVRRSHSQRRRSAKPSTRRSGRPKPPKSRGEQTTCHATLHFPPTAESAPVQRKPRRRLSIAWIAQADRAQQIETCTGMADRVVCVSVALPVGVSSPAFQVGSLAATLSTMACSQLRGSLERCSGAPRYMDGNACSLQGKTSRTASISSCEHRIGEMAHLSTFVARPEAPANSSSN